MLAMLAGGKRSRKVKVGNALSPPPVSPQCYLRNVTLLLLLLLIIIIIIIIIFTLLPIIIIFFLSVCLELAQNL